MPFSIARGQTHVVPLTITLTHPGDVTVSDVLFRRLSVRLEDESGAGVVPAQLLSRVALSEGSTVYRELVTLPTTGSTVDLDLTSPVRLASGGGAGSQVTLSFSLDVSDSTLVPSFRLVLANSTSMSAAGAVNGDSVPLALAPPQTFPIRSGLARIVAGATQLDVAGVDQPPDQVNRGQTNVGLLSLTLNNPGPVGLGPDVRLSAFAVSLVDSAGLAVANPAQVLERIQVSNAGRVLLDRPLDSQDSSAIAIALSPLLSVPINTPTPLQITAKIADAAALSSYRLRVGDPASFSARNATTGAVVPAILATTPIDGPSIVVQSPADTLRAMALPAAERNVAIGATDVATMRLVLRHPGGAGTASIRLGALTVRCRDQLSRLISPASVIERATVLIDGQARAIVANVPTAAAAWTIPLTGAALVAGQSATLTISCDIEASAPSGLFELSLASEGLVAVDDNSGAIVEAAPDSGAEFPLSSGFIELEAPARELSVGFQESMPPVLAAAGAPTQVGTLTFRNRSAGGQIKIDHLDLMAGDASFGAVAIGDIGSRFEAWISDTLWATVDPVPGSTFATLTGASAFTVGAGTPIVATVRMVARSGASGFRIGCRREGIGVVQPDSPLLFVTVSSDEGQTFPFWTNLGAVGASTLRESYTNFPNPFAAGRTSTSFSYVLPQDASVTLEVLTARGEKVITLLSGSSRAAGLHLEDTWDGRNGAGQVVVNGVYLAELTAQFPDGTKERVLRKIAVTR